MQTQMRNSLHRCSMNIRRSLRFLQISFVPEEILGSSIDPLISSSISANKFTIEKKYTSKWRPKRCCIARSLHRRIGGHKCIYESEKLNTYDISDELTRVNLEFMLRDNFVDENHEYDDEKRYGNDSDVDCWHKLAKMTKVQILIMWLFH